MVDRVEKPSANQPRALALSLLCYPQMLRTTLAVAAGFLILSVLAIATRLAMLRYLFHTAPGIDIDLLPPAYYLAYAAVRVIYAVIGGCVTAAIGKRYEAPTILGALLLGTAIGDVAMRRGGDPVWYAALVGLMVALAATMAGYRWLGRIPESAKKQG